MLEQSVIVWDLETVPDLAAARRLFDLGDAAEAEVREALGSGFPKHPLHKIACIGALVASRQAEGWRKRDFLILLWLIRRRVGTAFL
jgi:predicted PolB exonuclease-like 3'-5' exonuclease